MQTQPTLAGAPKLMTGKPPEIFPAPSPSVGGTFQIAGCQGILRPQGSVEVVEHLLV